MTQEVTAEIVEPEGIEVASTPGNISANFDALEARIDGILAMYDGWEPSADSADDVKQCKSERKYLNALAKDIDERRKAVKAEYLRPLNAFEDRANAIRDKIKATSARLDAVAKEAEQAEKDAKFSELQAYYEELAELLAPVVPYSRIHDDKWLNKSTGIKKAMEELEAKVERIASDWKSLKSLGLEYHEQAEAHFFNVLDLGQAVTYNAKLVEDRRRIEEMKAAMDPVPEPAPEPQPVPEPEPTPVAAYEPFEEASPYVMVIDSATPSQCREIGRFCGSMGVTGTFKRGTAIEVFGREFANGK